jgi:UDP-glucose 4-epimerase
LLESFPTAKHRRFELSKVLITGVAGLLGSHLADKYIQEGWSVIGIDNLVGGYMDNIPSGVEYHKIDCNDFFAIDNVLKGKKVDLVVHAACTAHEGLSVFSPDFIYRNTASASVSVLSASIANEVPKFIFCSSMARYGDYGGLPFTEDLQPKPQDPYAIAKVSAEECIKLMSKVHGIEYVILVPHNIIGPRQKYDDPFRNVASIMINRMLRGLAPIIYGDGEQTRSFSFISDVANPLYRSSIDARCSGEVINVGPDNNEITILNLAEIIAGLTKFKGSFTFVPERPQEVKHASCSADKARKLLEYSPEIDLETGLEQMISYIQKRGVLEFDYSLPLEIVSAKTPSTWKKRLI